jgi:hydrophobic/amphiphilic exporter-1 (mainly G- bacteria), HAE1 family
MTTLALVAGLVPMAVAQTPGSSALRSVAIIVIGGQSLCLLLTLLAIPVFYQLFDDVTDRDRWRGVFARVKGVFSGGRGPRETDLSEAPSAAARERVEPVSLPPA